MTHQELNWLLLLDGTISQTTFSSSDPQVSADPKPLLLSWTWLLPAVPGTVWVPAFWWLLAWCEQMFRNLFQLCFCDFCFFVEVRHLGRWCDLVVFGHRSPAILGCQLAILNRVDSVLWPVPTRAGCWVSMGWMRLKFWANGSFWPNLLPSAIKFLRFLCWSFASFVKLPCLSTHVSCHCKFSDLLALLPFYSSHVVQIRYSFYQSCCFQLSSGTPACCAVSFSQCWLAEGWSSFQERRFQSHFWSQTGIDNQACFMHRPKSSCPQTSNSNRLAHSCFLV